LSESRTAVIGEDRRLIEATERPLAGGGLVGDGGDVTALAAAQDAQARLVEAHAEVLERVGSAIAVFTPELRIAFFNASFVQMFVFTANALVDMSLTEMLEDLRARRMLPEVADFQAYKADRNADFQTLIEAREEYVCLPDGRTLKETTAPHPRVGSSRFMTMSATG
jgi:PAS domain-containing protein